jgi:ribosomal protein L29
MKAKELRDMSKEELQALLEDTRAEVFNLVNDARKTKKNEAPHLQREKKKTIARILTVLCEKYSEVN